MKRFTFTFAILGAFCACAFAGPVPMTSKEIQPVPVPPTSCFEGWYFGIHGGGIWANLDAKTSAFEETLPPRVNGFSESLFLETKKSDETSWEAGLHGGYNWQRGGWVFGFELDIQGTDLKRDASVFDFIQLPSDEGGPENDHFYSTEIHSKTALDWYGTGRIRTGHTLGDRVLAFATGGGAVGLTEVSEATSVIAVTTEGGSTSSRLLSNSDRGIQGGWTGGGGIDFCISQHWVLNFTYLYVDLGDSSASSSFFGTSLQGRTFDSETRARADFKFHDFRGGLTFHF